MNKARQHRQWLAEQISTKPDLVVRLDDSLWVIVIGNSYPHRDFLKRLGFHWKPSVRQWRFYDPIEAR